MNVTILGQGAMGSRMANRLAAHGHAVTRWNRTGSALSPREAVEVADIAIAMVRDDEASRAVWLDPHDGALSGLSPEALAIESSTLSVDWARELGRAMGRAGRAFIDAPVLGSRPQAEAGQLIHLIGGDAADVERAGPVLSVLGTRQLHVGQIGSGSALKLVANTLFGIQVVAVAELIRLAGQHGLDPARAIGLIAQTPLLSPAANGAAGLMLAEAHAPMFPVDLVAKDFAYALGTTSDDMLLASAAHGVFKRAIDQGLGDDNLTVVATLGGPVR